jgi:hypothetical protein
MNFRIRDFNKSLCHKCDNGHIIKAIEIYQGDNKVHPYITECTKFQPKGNLNDYEMKKIAWLLESKHGRIVGFKPPEVKANE